MIRVVLPFHLRNLARVDGEVELEVSAPVTVQAVLDALEARYPVLRGTIRDHGTLKRRPFIRFFACKEDLSLEPPDSPLPEAVVSGAEPFLIVGLIASVRRVLVIAMQAAKLSEEKVNTPELFQRSMIELGVVGFLVLVALSRWPGLLPPSFSVVYALAFCGGVYFHDPWPGGCR